VTSALEGPLQKMVVSSGDPIAYSLRVGDESLSLNSVLGRGLEVQFLGRISCRHCQTPTARSYGGGYCYHCFKTLARCDLCVVSPDRCHYHAGTCREPEWGRSFCMQPHLVYLANSSAAKVGITGAGNAVTRWADQGAVQGLVIMSADTRQAAGLAEVRLAKLVGDRTDWRVLVSRDAPAVDLTALRDRLRDEVEGLPVGTSWQERQPEGLSYPLLRYPRKPVALRLDERPAVRGNLVGVKGQYLLFEHGAFNVRHHEAYHVRVTLWSEALPPGAGDDQQLELFS